MSLASDILKAAAERMHDAGQAHAQRVGEVADEFKANLGKPWKFRVDAIREAQGLAQEIQAEQTKEAPQ